MQKNGLESRDKQGKSMSNFIQCGSTALKLPWGNYFIGNSHLTKHGDEVYVLDNSFDLFLSYSSIPILVYKY